MAILCRKRVKSAGPLDLARRPREHTFVGHPRQEPPKPIVVRQGRRAGSGDRPRSIRYCPHHGQTVFGLYGRARERWRCVRCVGEAVTRRHQKVRRILVREAGGRCAVCGYDRTPFNLHFHRVDPATKEFELNCGTGKSLAAFRVEAAKCVLVCANCHGEIEAGVVLSPPAGAKYGADWSVIDAAPAPPPQRDAETPEIEQRALFELDP